MMIIYDLRSKLRVLETEVSEVRIDVIINKFVYKLLIKLYKTSFGKHLHVFLRIFCLLILDMMHFLTRFIYSFLKFVLIGLVFVKRFLLYLTVNYTP